MSSQVDAPPSTTTTPRADGRTLGTHEVDLWERNEPYDALADALQAGDLVSFFTTAMRETCTADDPYAVFKGAGLASVVASMYPGVDVAEPTAQEFIDGHGLRVDEELRQLALDAVECARDEFTTVDDYFGEFTSEIAAELDVVANLLEGPRGE